MNDHDEQPDPAPEAQPGGGAPAPVEAEAADPGPGPEQPGGADGARPADSGEPDGEAFAALPVAEQRRRLRAQFDDPDWRSAPTRITLRRTAEQDPLGRAWISEAFPEARGRGGALGRSWAHAQLALDGTRLGRLDRPLIELLPAGGEFRVVLFFPDLGGSGALTRRGWRTPRGAMRDAERTFVRLLIEDNAAALAARQAADRAAGAAPAGDAPTEAAAAPAKEG